MFDSRLSPTGTSAVEWIAERHRSCSPKPVWVGLVLGQPHESGLMRTLRDVHTVGCSESPRLLQWSSSYPVQAERESIMITWGLQDRRSL